MQIWVDADACPGVVKEILFRAAERARIPLTLVAKLCCYCPDWLAGVDKSGHWVLDGSVINRLTVSPETSHPITESTCFAIA